MFRFEYTDHLYYLAIVPILLAVILYAWYIQRRSLAKIGDEKLVNRLMPAVSKTKYWIKHALILLTAGLLCIAWANPQWGTKKEKVKAESADVFIALDISQSMMAQDISPSRLERAKRFTQKLIRALKGNRIGLIYFAGSAYLQIPLTSDYAAAELFVRSANTGLAGTQGTAIAEAVELANKAFEEGIKHQRALILVSDGENHDQDAINAVEQANDDGLITFTIGVGTEDGSFVPFVNNGREEYKKDEEGNPVRSSLNIPLMQDIARAGDGEFYLVNQGEEAISDLKENIDRLEKKQVEQKSFTEFNSYFQYFLFVALLLMVGEYILSNRKA